MKRIIPISCACLFASLWMLVASDPGSKDWPMWGGTPDRNMVSDMKGIPTTWDVKTKKNVKWMAELGSQSYGNPVIAGGDRKSTRLNSSHSQISYAVFCLKKKKKQHPTPSSVTQNREQHSLAHLISYPRALCTF